MRDAIQRIALEDRHYGYRRIAEQLRREGLIVNAKRVLRLMREDNLLSLRFKPVRPAHDRQPARLAIVPNLTRGSFPPASIKSGSPISPMSGSMEDFVYLAVVLDAFSRKVVGWALDDHLEARLAIEALDMAIAARSPAADRPHPPFGSRRAICQRRLRRTSRGLAPAPA